MPYVYSTLANDNIYHVYAETSKDPKSIEPRRSVHSILIKGGAGIATKHLITPLGVVTQISEEDLKILEKDESFQVHVKNGFLKIDNKKVDVEVVVADMESRDHSAPIVPEDSKDTDAAKPASKAVTGKVKNNLK